MRPFSTITLPQDLSEFDLIIDARTENEYAEDHVPGAINLPVLRNQQHVGIGTLYKQNGFQASRQGAALISRNLADYIESELAELPRSHRILIYCWRGNLRSRSFAHVLSSIGWNVSVIEGGYRHYRNFVIEQISELVETQAFPFKIISGYTGSGKTHLLDALEEQGKQVLDLEALANHKGSLFGSPAEGSQPAQKQYESQLWQKLASFDPSRPVYVESESNRIGSLFCPGPLWKALKESEVIEVKLPLEERVKIIKTDYPHLLENSQLVLELLDKLVRLRGHEQVDQWKKQVEEHDWDSFILSLLVNHYDIAYKAAGEEGSSYLSPVRHLAIKDSRLESYAETASQL